LSKNRLAIGPSDPPFIDRYLRAADFALNLAFIGLDVDRDDLVPRGNNQRAVAERAIDHMAVRGLRSAGLEIDDVLIGTRFTHLVHDLDPVTRPIAFLVAVAGMFASAFNARQEVDGPTATTVAIE